MNALAQSLRISVITGVVSFAFASSPVQTLADQPNIFAIGGTPTSADIIAAAGETFNGSSGPDDYKGTIGADTAKGSSGADTLRGSDDDDTLEGGSENDLFDGQNGEDTCRGNSGTDGYVTGGACEHPNTM